jgi:hypothetical protein
LFICAKALFVEATHPATEVFNLIQYPPVLDLNDRGDISRPTVIDRDVSAAFSNERKINAKQALPASAAWLLPSLVAPLSTV